MLRAHAKAAATHCASSTHFTNNGWPPHGTGWSSCTKLVFGLTCHPRQVRAATDIAAAVGPCQPQPLQRLQAQWRSSRQGSLQGPRWTQSAVHSGASVGARPSKTQWCLHATLPATVCTHKGAAAAGQQGRLPRVEQRLQQVLHTGSGNIKGYSWTNVSSCWGTRPSEGRHEHMHVCTAAQKRKQGKHRRLPAKGGCLTWTGICCSRPSFSGSCMYSCVEATYRRHV